MSSLLHSGGLNDKRITVYPFSQPSYTRHPHEYVCRNFQNSLMHAKGDFIFLSDQDDIWLPYKVEVCLKDLENHDMVLHEFKHIDDNETVIRERHYDGTFRPKNYFLRVGKHYGCAMAFRRSVLDYALPFPDHLLLHDKHQLLNHLNILYEVFPSFLILELHKLKSE